MPNAIFGNVDFEPPVAGGIHDFHEQLAPFHRAHPQQFFEAERGHDSRDGRTNRQALDLPLETFDLLLRAFDLDLQLLQFAMQLDFGCWILNGRRLTQLRVNG